MIGRASPRVPNMGLYVRNACVRSVCGVRAGQLLTFIRMPSTIMHANQSRPTTTVIRSRLRSATEEPPTEDCMPPPNMSERPPPLPLCISTSSIISRLKTIRAIENPKTTAGPTSSDSDGRQGAQGQPYAPARVRRIAATAYTRPDSLIAEAHDLDELVGVQRGTA